MPIEISGTTGISGVDGSASSPALQGSDSNTGVSFGTDTVNINTGGSTRATVDSSGNLNIPNDSGKIQLGTSLDLQIHHDGNHSIIEETGTGNLFLKTTGSEIAFLGDGGSDYMVRGIQNGGVELYHNGSKKIETSSTGCGINSGAATDTMLGIKHTDGSGIEYITCRNQSDTLKMYVHVSGNLYNTNGSYGQISDQSLKENIVDAKSQWNDIKNIKIRNFNFTEASGYDTHTQIGCVAQEVETVSPKLVTTPREDGIKTVNTSVLYMKAIKALQEAQARIETLEAEKTQMQTDLTALTARVTALEAG